MSQLLAEVRDGVCWLRFNRPEVRNAWSPELGEQVVAALTRIRHDRAVRVVVLTGEGAGFCSGVDLRGEFDHDATGEADLRGMHHRRFVPAILALRSLDRPVIAAVNGAAVGYGCSLAMACDFVLAAESATFIFAFVNLGLLPDGGATAMLTARVGPVRATEIAMLGEPIPAARAAEWGLVTRVVPDDTLLAATSELAARLASGPTRAYAAIKTALHAAEQTALGQQMTLEGDLLQSLAETEDFVEGKAAFIERRQPHFVGR